jgi:hypothetical protein
MFAVLSDARTDPKGMCKPGVALIADPCGAVIARGASADCPVATASIDPELARLSDARRWLAARKPELYASLMASETQSYGDAGPWPYPEHEASARGSVALSFAVVGRKRPMR